MDVRAGGKRGEPGFDAGGSLETGDLSEVWDWIQNNAVVGNELTQWNARKRAEYAAWLDKWKKEHPNEPPPDPGKDMDPGMGGGEYDKPDPNAPAPPKGSIDWWQGIKDVLKGFAHGGVIGAAGGGLGWVWDQLPDVPWDQLSGILAGEGLSQEDIANARDQFAQYHKDSDARFNNRRGNNPRSPGDEETDPNNPGGGAGGVGTPRGGGGGAGGGGDYNFPTNGPNFDPSDPSTWPTKMGNQDYDWSQAVSQYGPMFNPTGGNGGGGNPFSNGGGMGQGGFPFGDSYYGTPGGGDPSFQQQRPDYSTDPNLARLAYQSQYGPNATIDYNRNPFQQGPGYNGTPGGDQRNVAVGYGGQMTKYNELPQYQAAVGQIDQQTAQDIAGLKDQFGAAGMRWSTPLLQQMGTTTQKAAADKNKLLLDMDQSATQQAWQNQMAESGQIYDRSRGQEQEKYGRWNTGDQKNYDQYMGLTGLDWNIAQGKGGLQNQMGNQTFQNVMGLNNVNQNQSNYLQGRDYGQYADQYNRQNDMEQRSYDRWKYGDAANYGRQQDAANMGMQLGDRQDARDRQMMMDYYGLGSQDEGAANADNNAMYQEWLRSMGQGNQSVDQLMQFITGAGGGPMMKQDKGFWDKYGGSITDALKAYFASGE